MKAAWRIGALLLLFMSVQLVTGALASAICVWAGVDYAGPEPLSWTLLASNLVLLVLLFATGYLKASETFRKYSWSVREVLLLIVMTFLAVFPVNVLTESLQLTDNTLETFSVVLGNPLGVFSVALLGPLVEELVFRKGIQGTMQKEGYPTLWCIFASSALFALIHFNPAQMPGAFLLGLFLGWVYWRTQSIWPVFLIHVVNNSFGVFTMLYFGAEATLTEMMPLYQLLGGSILCVVAFGFLIRYYHGYLKSREKKSVNW